MVGYPETDGLSYGFVSWVSGTCGEIALAMIHAVKRPALGRQYRLPGGGHNAHITLVILAIAGRRLETQAVLMPEPRGDLRIDGLEIARFLGEVGPPTRGGRYFPERPVSLFKTGFGCLDGLAARLLLLFGGLSRRAQFNAQRDGKDNHLAGSELLLEFLPAPRRRSVQASGKQDDGTLPAQRYEPAKRRVEGIEQVQLGHAQVVTQVRQRVCDRRLIRRKVHEWMRRIVVGGQGDTVVS